MPEADPRFPFRTLILDRERWARGDAPTNGAERNELLDERGCMCCLGFACGQAGILPSTLLHQAEPEGLLNDSYEGRWLVTIVPEVLAGRVVDIDEDDQAEPPGTLEWFTNTSLTADLMNINDQAGLTDERRVEALNEKLNPLGVTVVLVDTPAERAALGGLPAYFGEP